MENFLINVLLYTGKVSHGVVSMWRIRSSENCKISYEKLNIFVRNFAPVSL